MKSAGVSPSTERPSLSLTLTVWTMRRAPLRKTGGACLLIRPRRKPRTQRRRRTQGRRRVVQALRPARPADLKVRTTPVVSLIRFACPSKSQAHARLHFTHGVRRRRQTKLRAADVCIDARERHAIEDVGRVDPPVHVHPIAQMNVRPMPASIKELRGPVIELRPRRPIRTTGGRDVRHRVRVVAVGRGSGMRRSGPAKSADDAGAPTDVR